MSLAPTLTAYASLFDMTTGLDLAGLEAPELLAKFGAINSLEAAAELQKATTKSLAYIPLFYNAAFFAFDSNLNPGTYYSQGGGFHYCEFSWN